MAPTSGRCSSPFATRIAGPFTAAGKQGCSAVSEPLWNMRIHPVLGLGMECDHDCFDYTPGILGGARDGCGGDLRLAARSAGTNGHDALPERSVYLPRRRPSRELGTSSEPGFSHGP